MSLIGPAAASRKAVPRSFPLRAACVDTGSNAIRFLAAEFAAPDEWRALEYERVPVRLGHQVFLKGRLAPETMEAAVQAFASFRERMDALGIRDYRAVATSAVREARNGEELVGRILRRTGLELEPITGFEEARLVHLAVSSRIDLRGGHWILSDLGGGSVEVSLVDDAGILASESHTMGSVRVLEELAEAGDDPGRFQRLLEEYVSVLRIPSTTQYWEPLGFIATGGNIDSLAELATAPTDERGVARLPVADLERVIELLARMSYRERMERLGLRDDRADVILPAAMVYLRLARVSGAEEVRVPGVGVKEGLILDLVDDLTSHASHEERQEKQLVQAAVSLGRRFMFDEAHALQVSRIAGDLFDQLAGVHELDPGDRKLLRAGALLHDIGTFVAFKKHHKHSLYLIAHAELPGLSPAEMLIVANVARYHRKSSPAPRHDDFMRLSPDDRDRVRRMAALLRLADALDRARRQAVAGVTAAPHGDRLQLRLEGEGDLLLERWAVSRRAGLFEEVFGLEVVLET